MQEHCGGKFNSREIQCLYKGFRTLDKRHKGYISEDELMSIPELAISPLAPRVTQVFQNLNFKDFCRVLAAMSDRATREDKLDFMFRVSADLLVFLGIAVAASSSSQPRLTLRAPNSKSLDRRRCTTWTGTDTSRSPTWRRS